MTAERRFAARANVYDGAKCPAYAALGREPKQEGAEYEMVFKYDQLAAGTGFAEGGGAAILERRAKDLWLRAIEEINYPPAAEFGRRVAKRLGWKE